MRCLKDLLLFSFLVTLTPGCDHGHDHDHDKDQVLAQLKKADLLDGKEDKVVTKCAACSLGMDGSTDHKNELHGYEMHYCSAKCKEAYDKDGEHLLMELEIE